MRFKRLDASGGTNGLVEIVQELSEIDPVAHVRQNAKTLLEGIRLHGAE
ncbi:hypothetical protein [Actinomadura xylanilytica]|nr:hypothetical protein [Actinomadura xylanilytica]MDL4773631.1 hypothetical protein [Actinomadura xylanilytica]